MCAKNLETKKNIRKITALQKIKEKERYKMLTGLAISSCYKTSIDIREKEDKAFKKFVFYSNLEKALDKIGDKKNDNKIKQDK